MHEMHEIHEMRERPGCKKRGLVIYDQPTLGLSS